MHDGTAPTLHVAIICAGCGDGGSVANVALHHAEELCTKASVTLMSDRFPDEIDPRINQFPLRKRTFGFLRRFAHVPNELAFVRAARMGLARLHDIHPLDAVIVHGHALGALAAQPFSRTTGVPFAMVTHGDIFYRPPGTYDRRLTFLYEKVTPLAYRSATRTIALSPFMAECAVKGGATQENVVVMPNGINIADIGLSLNDRHHRNGDAAQRGPLNLLFVGRLSVEKGVADLIHACARLVERDIAFVLNIIGDGPLRLELEKLVRNQFAPDQIVFQGKLPRSELGRKFQQSDVVCVPSTSEPLATVILEALVAECPVVASDTGGNPFMIQHEENGLVFPAGDVESLANALARLHEDRDLLLKLGSNTRSSVLESFSWNRTGEKIFQLLSDMNREAKNA